MPVHVVADGEILLQTSDDWIRYRIKEVEIELIGELQTCFLLGTLHDRGGKEVNVAKKT